MKIRPVGAELFHAGRRTEGQTDMTKLTVTFRNFANAPKIIRDCKISLWPTALCTVLLKM